MKLKDFEISYTIFGVSDPWSAIDFCSSILYIEKAFHPATSLVRPTLNRAHEVSLQRDMHHRLLYLNNLSMHLLLYIAIIKDYPSLENMGAVTALILSAVVVCAFANHDIPNKYDFQLNLTFQQPGAAPFKFFYTYDRDNQLLKMAVKVLSLGWVGIGFSRNQFMPDTDVAIGWVDDLGRGFLQVGSCESFCGVTTYLSVMLCVAMHNYRL